MTFNVSHMQNGYRKVDSEQIKQVITLYENGQSLRQIETVMPFGRTAIARILRMNNIPTIGSGNVRRERKYQFDLGYFEDIDSAEKAYWLGFICADGHVADDGVVINLSIKDKNHLSKLKDSIGFSGPLKSQKKNISISLWSIQLVSSLRKLGLTRNKTFDLIYPNVPSRFEIDLMRGMFDGDGTIRITRRKRKRYISIKDEYSVGFCGTENVVKIFCKLISDLCLIKSANVKKAGNIYIVEWSGHVQCLKILERLYGNSTTYLERKYERYLALRGHQNEMGRNRASHGTETRGL